MGLRIKILAFFVGIAFFLFVLRSIKRNGMRPSYAVLWMVMALFLISVPALEPLYQWIAGPVLGIIDARHVIYMALIGFLMVYVFYLTLKICQMSDRIQELISYTAIMETEKLIAEGKFKKR